jgi:hypothetical protein
MREEVGHDVEREEDIGEADLARAATCMREGGVGLRRSRMAVWSLVEDGGICRPDAEGDGEPETGDWGL